MILVISPGLAGPLAVAIATLRRWYSSSDPRVREDLVKLQTLMEQVAKGRHSPTPFDSAEMVEQAGLMKLAVTYETAGAMLSCDSRTISRRVRDGELATIGDGPGRRVTVRSLESFVARASMPRQEGQTA